MEESLGEHVRDRMARAVKYMGKGRPSPTGKRERSPEELQVIWDAILDLEPEAQTDVMKQLAKASGHKDDEKLPCEMCRFVTGRIV